MGDKVLRVGSRSFSSLSVKEGQRLILGIDPGSTIMGYAVILAEGNVRVPQFVVAGAVVLSKYKDHYHRLGAILNRVESLLVNYHPHEMAVEAPFFGINPQSMLKLGRAQGVAIAAGMRAGLPIGEYAPRKVKIAVTGNGNASKEQVAGVLQRMYPDQGLEDLLYPDATDGLAVALCHYYNTQHFAGIRTQRLSSQSHSSSSWDDFLAKNPDRVKS